MNIATRATVMDELAKYANRLLFMSDEQLCAERRARKAAADQQLREATVNRMYAWLVEEEQHRRSSAK
jgi:hypothetical protein